MRNPAFLYRARAGRLDPDTWRTRRENPWFARAGRRRPRKQDPSPFPLRASSIMREERHACPPAEVIRQEPSGLPPGPDRRTRFSSNARDNPCFSAMESRAAASCGRGESGHSIRCSLPAGWALRRRAPCPRPRCGRPRQRGCRPGLKFRPPAGRIRSA